MKRIKELSWYAYYHNINSNKIEPYNVLAGMKDFLKKTKKRFPEKRDFSAELNREMKYRFWSKCEWEIQLAPWPYHEEHDEMVKIDVYEQLAINWEQFVDYCWEAV